MVVQKKHAILKIPSLPAGAINHSLDNLNKVRGIEGKPLKIKIESKNELNRNEPRLSEAMKSRESKESNRESNRDNIRDNSRDINRTNNMDSTRDSNKDNNSRDSTSLLGQSRDVYLNYMNNLAASSSSSRRSRKSFLIQADELYCGSNCSKKQKLTGDLASFDVDQVYESTKILEAEGLEVFNPINCHVSVYITKLEKLLAKHGLLSSAIDIIPHFLETVGNQYLNHIKHTKEHVDFEEFKSLFIQKFRSFKSLKINEALACVYEGGCLLEFTRKKLAMVQYVFPKMEPSDVISICIGSFNSKELIEAFSKSAHKDIQEFIGKVALMRLKFPNLFQ